MATGSIDRTIPAPRHEVWEVFADFGNVQEINVGIESSKATNPKAGVGGQRVCEFGGGRGVTEDIVAWQDHQTIAFEAIEFRKMPMKKMVATFSFAEVEGGTKVTASWVVAMPGGFLTGWMANLSMKRAMRDMLQGAEDRVLEALAV